MNYSKIILIVHPLFDVVEGYYDKKIPKDYLLDELRDRIYTYGKEIIRLKKDKSSIFFIIEPNYERDLIGPYKFNIYKKISKRFEKFAKSLLGDRLIITRFSPLTPQYSHLNQKILKKLDKTIKIISFGEYLNLCVKRWTTYTKLELRKRGFKVNAKILKKYSYL